MNKIVSYRDKGLFCFRKRSLGFTGALLLLFCPGIAYSWSGVIIDKATKRPIEGAVIVRSWDNYYPRKIWVRSILLA